MLLAIAGSLPIFAATRKELASISIFANIGAPAATRTDASNSRCFDLRVERVHARRTASYAHQCLLLVREQEAFCIKQTPAQILDLSGQSPNSCSPGVPALAPWATLLEYPINRGILCLYCHYTPAHDFRQQHRKQKTPIVRSQNRLTKSVEMYALMCLLP